MRNETVDLYGAFGIVRPNGARGNLTCYIHDNSDQYCPNRIRPAVLIIPGGAYYALSHREGEPIAIAYFAKGYNAFVLDYSCAPIRHPAQLVEASMAIAYIRANSIELHINNDQIVAIGFSAGGHLAAMLGTISDNGLVKEVLGTQANKSFPNAVILGYSVITSDKNYCNKLSFDNLVGADEKMRACLSIEKKINSSSAPAFIWCTADDEAVSAQNSMMLANAYFNAGVPFELHIFESGVHGMALANRETAYCSDCWSVDERVASWFDLSVSWLAKRGFRIID